MLLCVVKPNSNEPIIGVKLNAKKSKNKVVTSLSLMYLILQTKGWSLIYSMQQVAY